MTDHILVIHRWRDRHALYEHYIDHHAHRVSYVTTELGRASVPETAAEIVTVPATDDLGAVRAAAETLTARFGPPARVLALNEGDLDTAARLRAHLGYPGQRPDRLARFRDKLTMVRTVSAAGLAVPAFADAPGPEAVLDFADAHGWPVVVKPRRGTASRGVLRLDSAGEVSALGDLPPEPRLVQRFCPDPVYHVDGLWTGTELGPWRASRYLNTCVDFTVGEVLGSVEVDDPDLLGPLGDFTAAVAGALSDRPWVFHLEVFVGSGGDGLPRITFLEAGYRVGGAEIPFLWREVHGIDLMAAAADVQLGRTPSLRVPATWETGGWLLVPTPVPAPCRVVSAELRIDPQEGPYARVVPPVGRLVPRVGGYEHVGARFRFRGACTDDVEKAIVKTASQFRLVCSPVP
ncbi:acetyl-CoA carboxylase biotin carboxylase subunit family protein [Streptosporangium sp. NPDC050855]|uniref:acetyl-CoA carboxylase biotin carboxylase subunit family protein n=1 Tax=Streptosporangium sp. NPDC050855 TaxID=3366194 RepID=UPI0037A8B501